MTRSIESSDKNLSKTALGYIQFCFYSIFSGSSGVKYPQISGKPFSADRTGKQECEAQNVFFSVKI
jgi:hypothetical protein